MYCPDYYSYFARFTIYLKYVEKWVENGEKYADLPAGSVINEPAPITSEDIGITIEFENGERLTWQLSEIYPETEIPPPPSYLNEVDWN